MIQTDRDRYEVIDVDLHLDERPQDLAPFCELPWQRVLNGSNVLSPPWNIRSALYPRLTPHRDPGETPRTPDDLRRSMRDRGVDAAILLPGSLLKLGLVHTADYAAALARAYNQWLVETWISEDAGLFGAVLAAPHDAHNAAQEIGRHGAHKRIVGVVLPTAGMSALWGDRRFDPIYAAAEAAGLPVILHGADGVMVPSSVNQVTQFASEFDQSTLDTSLIAMANMTHMVGTGVLARYPRLRLLFLGAGISWLTHMMLRLDKEYNENRRDVPYYDDRVSLAIKRQVWVGAHPVEDCGSPGDLDDLIRISCGIDRVVFGAHWPLSHADAPERVAATLGSDEARRKVLGANARTLFGIGDPTT